ncbi:DUF6153 family protein [Streptomyces sparsogenes]|uniref:DUF6153 family protein n=1 Tax=Streptomyces sparsogenes TaxID=67365 RepID=UPI0033DFFCC1
MPTPEQNRPSPPARRWRALLVLGLLAGLLGMHALGPSGALMPRAHERPASMETMGAATPAATAAVAHGDCHGGGSHLHHADPSCASPALGGGPSLSAPPAVPVAVCDHAVAATRSGTPPSPADGRAPPTLAELQLLRI